MLQQQLVSGVATGAIYALIALAVVLIYQTTHQINLAQGEIATFTTFVALQLISSGVPYWAAFALTLAFAFVLSVLVYQTVIRPLTNAAPFLQIGAVIALLLIFNSTIGFLWGQDSQTFPTPFGIGPIFGSTLVSAHRAGMLCAALLIFVALHLFLSRSAAGLRFRAVAENPISAELVGIPVERTKALAWGLAGAIAGAGAMLIAPVLVLDSTMMFVVLPYGLAAAILGGITRPAGAIVGGLALGIFEALATAYLPAVGRELKFALALGVILLVLVIRPQGLLGSRNIAGR